jgi:predicted DNA binding protein
MRYAELTLRFDEGARHPAQRLIDEHDAVERDMLLYGNTATAGWDTFMFYVEGEREPYRWMLDCAGQVREYELIDGRDGEGFYAYVEQEPSDLDDSLFSLFSRTGLVLVPPVEFLDRGRARLTVLGNPDVLSTTMDELPDSVSATVERVGRYRPDAGSFTPPVTTRQREALTVAVELGYYELPREATLTEVADALGCSTGTASEHLRKAERTVLSAVVGRPEH